VFLRFGTGVLRKWYWGNSGG